MIPQYEFFHLPPSAMAVDPETPPPPLPRWLMLAFGASAILITLTASIG